MIEELMKHLNEELDTLSRLSEMSLSEIQLEFNVDTLQEAKSLIEDQINDIQNDISKIESEDYQEYYVDRFWVAPFNFV